MGSIQLCAIVLCALFYVCCAQLRREAYATVPQLIASSGYPVEKHRVTTEDGYVLQIFRIPAGRRSARRTGSTNAKGKRAVVMFHGLFGNSGNFVLMGPRNSLAYILADAGYDVWLANLRGNLYTAHKNLTRNDAAFWDFSFHEHGKYDAPAIIDKILNITGLSKIFYVGHSMGTTTFFTMISQRPEYNDKLVAFVAMAPAVYLDHLKMIANFFLKSFDLISVLRRRGYNSLSIRPDMLALFAGSFCTARQPQTDICMRIVYAIVGEDYDLNPWDMVPTLVSSMHPASFRQLEHFGKIALTGTFTSWENGLWGEVKPYKIENVKIPVTILYGMNDQLTEKSQVMRLADQLNSTGVLESLQPGGGWPKFNHLDFIFAKDVGKMVNKPLVEHIGELYNKYYNE
ncbi:hypothetical protein ABMA27_003491 [Loxostege sticticalis]|uniref:Lipase n=1 Tax=Loxostege sticticalis TaxID=481309 RepID=A0ABR3HT82_LOXSC